MSTTTTPADIADFQEETRRILATLATRVHALPPEAPIEPQTLQSCPVMLVISRPCHVCNGTGIQADSQTTWLDDFTRAYEAEAGQPPTP